MAKGYKGRTGYVGSEWEGIVAGWLDAKGYDVICSNYASPYGEIDIIAMDGGYVVFIEVKYRKNPGFGLPREAVTAAKQGKIIKTALSYIEEKGLESACFRFDVVEVYGYDGMRIEHIEDAFQCG